MCVGDFDALCVRFPVFKRAALYRYIYFFVVHPSRQEELLKDNAHANFIKHLVWEDMPARQRVLAAFVLTCVMNGKPKGQEKCLQKLLHTVCFDLLEDGAADVSDVSVLCFRRRLCMLAGSGPRECECG